MFQMIGGPAALSIMEDYFPIMIDTGTDIMGNLIFIDKNGIKVEPDICNAIFNSMEIDT
jgi:hypothetical protein